MAQQPPEAKRVVQPVGRESVLHSEVTMYHPTGEEHPEVDKETSSVPSAKRYLLWLLVLAALIGLFLYLMFR